MRRVPQIIGMVIILVFLTVGYQAHGQDPNALAKVSLQADSDEAAQEYRKAAKLQNDREFAAAVSAWQDFLETYPDDRLVRTVRHYLGTCFLQQGEYRQAAEVLRKVVDDESKFDFLDEAYMNLGWACYMSGSATADQQRLNEAARVFSQYVRRYPKGDLVDQALFYQGESHYQVGQLAQARKAYDRLVRDFPSSTLRAEGLYALATTRQDLGQVIESRQLFQKFLKEFDENPLCGDVLMRIAHGYQKQEQFDRAELYFAQAAAIRDFDSADQAMFQRAYCLTVMKDNRSAAKVYAQVSHDFPDSPLAHQAALEAGRCFYRSEQFQPAIKWFTKVIKEKEPSTIEATHWICRILFTQGNTSLATKLAQKGLDFASQQERQQDIPFLADLELDLAQAADEINESKPATLKLYQSIATRHPKTEVAPVALYRATQIAYELEDYQQAIRLADDFGRLYSKHKLHSAIVKIKESCVVQIDDDRIAAHSAKSLIENDHSESPYVRLRLAKALYQERKFEEVLRMLDGLPRQFNDKTMRAQIHGLMGACHWELQQDELAIASFTKSLSLDDHSQSAPLVWSRLSQTLERMGRHEQATQSMRQLTENYPNHAESERALLRLAKREFADEMYDDARKTYNDFLGNFPNSSLVTDVKMELIKIDMCQGLYDDANESLTDLISRDTANSRYADAIKLRATCREKLGKFNDCLSDVAIFLDETQPGDPTTLTDRGDVLLLKAVCEIEREQWSNATHTLAQILAEDPEYAQRGQVLYYQGWIELSQGRDAEACRKFEMVCNAFPTSPFAAESSYHLGEIDYDNHSYDQAAAKFRTALDSNASESMKEKAAYKLAWCWYQLRDFESARAGFSLQVEDYPEGELLHEGRFMLAETLTKLGAHAEALRLYTMLPRDRQLAKDTRELVMLHAGQCCNRLGQHHAAIAWLEKMISRFPNSQHLAKLHYELGMAERSVESGKAMENFEIAARTDTGEIGARARFCLAKMCSDASPPDAGRAIREFQTLMYGYGGKQADAAVRYWQAKAAIEAGRTARNIAELPQTSDPAQWSVRAEKFFRYVVEEYPATKVAKEAQLELVQLAQLSDPNSIR